MQVNVQFLQQLQPKWSRFVTIVKQQQDLDTVSYHKLFDVLKQYQKEVNEIHAERISKECLTITLPDLVHYQYKGKEIAKPITPPSESASEEDSDPEQAQRDKDMQKNLALIAKYFKNIYKPTNNNLRTSLNSRNKNVDTTPRVKDYTYHKENMLLCKQAEKGVPLQAEQYDWLADTDEEIDEQELEAHYSYMAKIQEVPTADLGTDSEPLEQVQYDTGYNVFANEIQHSEQFESISNTCVVETDDNNVIPDSPDMCDNDIQNDQNDVNTQPIPAIDFSQRNLFSLVRSDDTTSIEEKEAIHLLLTGIGDDIYSTVDACKTTYEMWIAIERLQQGKSLNIQDVKTNLFWEFGKFTSHDGESMESYYFRFYKMMNEMIRNNLAVATMQYSAPTKFKGKEIAKPITPPSESPSEEYSDPEQAQRDKDMQKNLALIAKYFKKICKPTNNNLRTSLNSKNKNVDTTLRYKNDNQTRKFGNQRTVTVAGARETVQYDTGYNVFANEIQHSEQSESISNTCVVETDDNDVIPDSLNMCDNDIQNDQNDVVCDDERVVFANLIANLKLDVDENKKIQKQLKKANTTLAHELTECKSILAETSRSLEESNSTRDSCLFALQNKQTELEKYKTFNDLVKEKHDELVKQSLLTKSHYEGLVKEKTKVITDLKLKEEKDIDKMISMENQLKFLNEIVYKRSQSIQTIHMLAPKCPTFNGRPTFANPKYLKKAQSEIPCLYEIPHDQSDPANRLVPDREETLTLERESRSKLNKDLVKPYDYTKLNSLYEIFKPPTQEYQIQLAHANEVRKKMWRKSFVKTKPNIFKNIDFLPVSKSISKSRQAYNVMTNNINHLREIVDQAWVKHLKDHFRAPTALDMEVLIKTCLMPLAIKTQNDSFAFVHELKQEMHANLKYVESIKKEIDKLESDKAEFSNMYDMLLQECVSNDVMCSYLHSLSDLDAHSELQCLYLHKMKECECLAQKLSKQTECVICKEKTSNVFQKEREQYFDIQDLKAQLQDKNIAISELKKLIEKYKGKYVETKFDKPSVVRQQNAQRIPKPSVLGKPAPFLDSLERKSFSQTKSVPKTNVSESLSKPVTT
ncbi:hypothetical protein Tco_0511633 [Tanacetum coccineum]